MISEVMTATLEQAGANVLSAAIGVLGSRLAAAATGPRGRKAEDLSIARWFETYTLKKSFPELPGLSDGLATQLTDVLGSDAVQAALQVLLAVRLTDADDVEAGRARDVFCLTLSSADLSLSPFGPPLAEYYDDEISSLAARLEAAEPAMLAQIRSEALSARMIAVLRAIERHTAALNARPNVRTEASFLASYRGHVLDRHGKLEPPDFDRRRRVPIADIYVPPTIYENTFTERTVTPLAPDPPSLSVWDLAERLDRTVLLGDPGGGKTTASNVLMHHFASDASHKIPFLVTLRNYAASDPPKHSVAGYIENELSTFYQCPAPPGLVDMLLLTGRAVVLFDGLDELLDTSRRADVASRVEHFCREYPQAPVLVTSRVVGYDQARLDETQFATFRLDGFRDEDVTEYARKWFALQEGGCPDDADAFLTESESVPDLRGNPLLLSLMCILYRGEGSLPRNRAEVYGQCASLLFHRWDARRRIHQELRAGHLLEQTLRHLAWWLFTRDSTETAVTERELIAATTEFLHGRGFESEDEARDAAREFIQFCRGRMWVFNEAGITAGGEKLYSFTHRTFLEYFAASKLAFDCDTPEKLARTIAPYAARGAWEVVSELAVQIKDRSSSDGASRIYQGLLSERRRRSSEGRSNILQFLARTLRSAPPSPQDTRRLTREAVRFLFSGNPDDPIHYAPLGRLLSVATSHLRVIGQEVSDAIAEMIASEDPASRSNGIRLSLAIDRPAQGIKYNTEQIRRADDRVFAFWSQQATENARRHRKQIEKALPNHEELVSAALRKGAITFKQALEASGGLHTFITPRPWGIFSTDPVPEFVNLLAAVGTSDGSGDRTSEAYVTFKAIGTWITAHKSPPWTSVVNQYVSYRWEARDQDWPELDPITNLGGIAVSLIMTEAGIIRRDLEGKFPLGPFSSADSYVELRSNPATSSPLPDLPVPNEFKQVFRDWAAGKVNFTAPDPPDQS